MAILTISRQFGSGGREIGQAVSRELGYDYIDREKILQEIRQAGEKWEKWTLTLDEHRPTVWEKYDWSFKGFSALMQSTILQQALKNNVVLIGRGANFLLKDIPHALRLRVNAPLDRRIERIMKRDSVDSDTARWLIERTDRERAAFIRQLYDREWDDASEYDMVFDTGTRTLEDIESVVRDALLTKERLHTDAVEKVLHMRALSARVKAGILTDHHFFVPTLEVLTDKEGLILRGVIHDPVEHRRIEERAKSIAGDVPLKCELHYRR